mmetsp:Transcript_4619/g.16264  ORF Transcript_4619/g.16264 Transcript_4619/m.16264 type:complete len:366 (-) Transcript_4619:1061-2158(-)
MPSPRKRAVRLLQRSRCSNMPASRPGQATRMREERRGEDVPIVRIESFVSNAQSVSSMVWTRGMRRRVLVNASSVNSRPPEMWSSCTRRQLAPTDSMLESSTWKGPVRMSLRPSHRLARAVSERGRSLVQPSTLTDVRRGQCFANDSNVLLESAAMPERLATSSISADLASSRRPELLSEPQPERLIDVSCRHLASCWSPSNVSLGQCVRESIRSDGAHALLRAARQASSMNLASWMHMTSTAGMRVTRLRSSSLSTVVSGPLYRRYRSCGQCSDTHCRGSRPVLITCKRSMSRRLLQPRISASTPAPVTRVQSQKETTCRLSRKACSAKAVSAPSSTSKQPSMLTSWRRLHSPAMALRPLLVTS